MWLEVGETEDSMLDATCKEPGCCCGSPDRFNLGKFA